MSTKLLFILSLMYQILILLSSNNTNTTLSPTMNPLSPNITSLSPSNSPSASPSVSPSVSPSAAPSVSPTLAINTSMPTISPNTSSPTMTTTITTNTSLPTLSPTVSPTTTPTMSPSSIVPFTTTEGININPTQQLLVNFSLTFTSQTVTTVDTMDKSLKLAYSQVGIGVNYVYNTIKDIHHNNNNNKGNDSYFYDIFSMIDAKDMSQAYQYENQINSDPDSGEISKFAKSLSLILDASKLNMSIPKFDIVPVTSNNGNGDSDTSQIIIWFLGISATAAVISLILIMCWRKFSSDDDKNNQQDPNSINLEFLLDPNANDEALFASPMHLNNENNNDGDNDGDDGGNDDDDNDDIENDQDLKPIKRKKKKIKKKYFSRLGDDNNNDADGEDDDLLQSYEEYEEEEQENDQNNNPLLMDNYEPPNFSRI